MVMSTSIRWQNKWPMPAPSHMGMFENLTLLISEALKEGNTVTIDGLGTFSVTAQPNRDVEEPSKIRAESIKLKGIGFKPSPKLKDRLSDIEFTRLK